MDVMQEILNIEKTARNIADSASEMQASHEDALAAELQHREEKVHQDAQAQLEQLRLRMDAERQEQMERLEAVYQEKLEALAQTSKASQETWIQEITQAILNR